MLSNTVFLLAASAGLAVADFTIGNCATTGGAGKPLGSNDIALPGSSIDCNYRAVPQGQDICNAKDEIRTQNNGGVCPGNDDNRSLSFCDLELSGSGCPASYQMNIRDDCGDVALKDGALPKNGFFYADLIDTAKNNIAVGRCVYEVDDAGQKQCPDGPNGEDTICQTFIKCYTSMYGQSEC